MCKRTCLFVAGAAMITAAGWAQSSGPISPPGVDGALKVKDGSMPVVKAYAKGVQIYTCKAGEAGRFAFDADHAEPDAVLANEHGDIVIHHYFNLEPAGPAWEAKDGGKLVAKKVEAEKRPGTIPWLLLQVVNHEGSGLLGGVTYIQRVDTQGGVAPAGECDPAKTQRVRAPYSATYYFYGPGR